MVDETTVRGRSVPPPGSASVAYARDGAGRVWAALTAPRDESYHCLACGHPLALQRKADQRASFRHGHPAPCDGSRAPRYAARQILQAQLLEELSERDAIVWHRRCRGRGDTCRDRTVFERWEVVAGWAGVEIDVAEAGVCWDVAVLGPADVLIGIRLIGPEGAPIDGRGAEAGSEREHPRSATLLLDEVLAFGPREPLERRGRQRCPGCEAAVGTGREGIGWDETWRGVMAAAGGPGTAEPRIELPATVTHDLHEAQDRETAGLPVIGPLPYAHFQHPDGSWYRLWITHTTPKTERGHAWHLHASYDKSGTLAPIAGTRWFEKLYGMANWDFHAEGDAVEAFRERAGERLGHGYELREGALP